MTSGSEADTVASAGAALDKPAYHPAMRTRRPQVKAKLAAWRLGFRVRDGIQAGVTANNAIAWVAANVDAIPQNEPTDKPVPYRVLFLPTSPSSPATEPPRGLRSCASARPDIADTRLSSPAAIVAR